MLGLILPERDSAPESRRLARKLAQGLGICHKTIRLTPLPAWLGAYWQVPRWLVSTPRLYARMVCPYHAQYSEAFGQGGDSVLGRDGRHARTARPLAQPVGRLSRESSVRHSELQSATTKASVQCQWHGEKANGLLVARRQKHQGMHWSLATSDGLAALKTLVLNHG